MVSVVAVVVLVVTAGCGALGGGDGGAGGPTATPTQEQTTTDGPGTPTAVGTTVSGDTEPPFDAERLPPGVATDGSVNVTRLGFAHEDALSGSAFTVRLNLTRAITVNGTTQQSVATQVARTDGSGEFVSAFSQEGRFTLAQTTWGNESVAVARVNASGSVRFQRADPDVVRGNITARRFVDQFMGLGNYTVAVAGEDRVVLTTEEPAAGVADELGDQVTDVASYTGRVVVDRQGRVRSMEASIVAELANGGRADIALQMGVGDIGETTVERPEWVPEALNETDSASGRLVAPPRAND